VSGYVVSFDLYQGKGVDAYKTENVKAVGAPVASVLDLLDLIPEEKLDLPYHIFADNHRNHQTGPCQGPPTVHASGRVQEEVQRLHK
jgi:hypothetical protein